MQQILNFVEVSHFIGTGGQPDQSGIEQLPDKGYKAIINVRTSGEEFDQAGEEKQALELGLRVLRGPRRPKEVTGRAGAGLQYPVVVAQGTD